MDRIYIIDSVNTALSVSLHVAQCGTNCSLVYEKKTGIDDQYDLRIVCEKIYENLTLLPSKIIEVPSLYFLAHGENLLKRISMRRWVKRKICKDNVYDMNATYIGPRTSSIMQSLTSARRIFIDHGCGEYGTRAKYIINPRYRFVAYFKHWLMYVLGMPNHDASIGSEIISLCKMENDWAFHIDYQLVRVTKHLEDLFKGLRGLIQGDDLILCLLEGERHTKDGLPVYSGLYDAANLNLIMNHASPNNFVILKFHPALYLSGNKPNTQIDKLLIERGIKSIVLDDHLPEDLKSMIPSEIIVKYFLIKKIICECSATVCNTSHVENISSICDFKAFPDFYMRNQLSYQSLSYINNLILNKIQILK